MSRIQDCCFKTNNPCYYAAGDGHLACLQYAHEHGCPWDESTCYGAVYNGHLECLRYAHEHGCPWGESTCNYATEKGQLECLRYAYENGCPWDKDCFYEAVKNKRFKCLKYLIAHEWKTWKELKPQIVSIYGKFIQHMNILNNSWTVSDYYIFLAGMIQNINILNNSWTVSNYIFLAGMIQPSSHIYKHFYNHSLIDLNLINEILSLL